MKNKGFTLMELLAVIVVLAIIALIATPMVLDTINKAIEGATKSSIISYNNALETAIATSMVNGSKLTSGIYTLDSNGNITSPVELVVNVKGDKASEGKVCVTSDGSVKAYSLKIGNSYVTSFDGINQEITDGIKNIDCPILASNLAKGIAIYFNPESKTICDSKEAVSATGTHTGCMKWYVYKENGNGTYQLILDHNTTATARWSSTSSNNTNADAAVAQLNIDTTSWNSSLLPRLITADEVAEITGANLSPYNFNGATVTWDKYFFFDTNTTSNDETLSLTKKSKYAWLFDYTTGCTGTEVGEYGCNIASDIVTYGYWTSTPIKDTPNGAWFIISIGGLMSDISVDVNVIAGIRPVITV